MKLDAKTLKILKNFSDINQSIQIKSGNVLSTISGTKTILAKAKVADTFPTTFAIYDLSKLLSVLSLFQEPEIDFDKNQLVVSKDKNKVHYTYADPKTIVLPPEKEIKLPTTDVQFTLTQEMFTAVSKAMSILSLPEMAVVGENGELKLCAIDSKNPSGDSYEVDLGVAESDFRVIFKNDNLKLIPGNYNVSVSSKGLSRFVGDNIEYFIAVESSSTFK